MARKKRVDNDIHTNISYSQVDFWLLLSVVLLVGIGTMMIFSASTPSSYSKTPDSTAYDVLKTQIVYTVVGIAILFVVSMADYKYLQPLSLYPAAERQTDEKKDSAGIDQKKSA